MPKGNFDQFLEALGAFESGKPSGDPAQYSAQNLNTKATGKYQFTEVIFADLGYYTDNNLYDAAFNGTWTGKNGVTSLDSWKANSAAQETAIRAAFSKNYGYVNYGLNSKVGTSTNIDVYLSNTANQGVKTVTYYKLNDARTDFVKDANGQYIKYTDQVSISLSGILAGAHLRGGFGVAEVLAQLNNKSSIDFTTAQFNVDYYKTYLFDEINTPILKYLNDFGDYTVSNSDFTLTNYGDATNYVLYGTLNNDTINGGNGNSGINGGGNDTLVGGAGKDTLTGGNGADRFDYRKLTDSLLNNNNFDVITDFNAAGDKFLVSTARAGSLFNGGDVATLDAEGIAAKLTTTNFAANFAAQFTFGSRTFVAINDATAGFNANTDAIIEVTGLTGTLGASNFTV